MRVERYRDLWTDYADKPPRKRRTNLEHAEQAAVVQWCEMQKSQIPELDLIFAIPNQSQGSVQRGKYYKAEGQRAGIPDLMLPVPRGNFHGLFIEMKGIKGRITDEQRAWNKALREQGYACLFAFGAVEAIRAVEAYLEGKWHKHDPL